MTELTDKYYVIYDGNCNLCVSLVKLLEKLDQGKTFNYAAMQEQEVLSSLDNKNLNCIQYYLLVSGYYSRSRGSSSSSSSSSTRYSPYTKIKDR